MKQPPIVVTTIAVIVDISPIHHTTRVWVDVKQRLVGYGYLKTRRNQLGELVSTRENNSPELEWLQSGSIPLQVPH